MVSNWDSQINISRCLTFFLDHNPLQIQSRNLTTKARRITPTNVYPEVDSGPESLDREMRSSVVSLIAVNILIQLDSHFTHLKRMRTDIVCRMLLVV